MEIFLGVSLKFIERLNQSSLRFGNRNRSSENFWFVSSSPVFFLGRGEGSLGFCEGGKSSDKTADMNGLLEDISVRNFMQTCIGIFIFLSFFWRGTVERFKYGTAGNSLQLILEGFVHNERKLPSFFRHSFLEESINILSEVFHYHHQSDYYLVRLIWNKLIDINPNQKSIIFHFPSPTPQK